MNVIVLPLFTWADMIGIRSFTWVMPEEGSNLQERSVIELGPADSFLKCSLPSLSVVFLKESFV